MPSTWTVLAAALFLWLGGMQAGYAQTINVQSGESKTFPIDYIVSSYNGGSIAQGGTLTVNAGNTLTIDSGFTLDNSGTLNNVGVIAGSVLGIAGTAVIRNDRGGLISSSGGHAVYLQAGGTVTNGAGSTIRGQKAVESLGETTLRNAGTLSGDVKLDATAKHEVTLVTGSQITGELNIGTKTESTLTLEGSGQQLYSTAVSGVTTFAGVLRMTGTGSWILDKALNSANTIIDSGTLVAAQDNALGSGVVNVGGSGTLQVNSGVVLTNALNLRTGGTLSGTGTVGIAGSPTTVQRGAVIRGGDSVTPYGTLTVAGNLEMQAGAILQVRVDPTSNQASLVNVTGTATLAGSVLHVGNVVNAASDFQVGKTYTILTAGTLQGRFEPAKSDFAFLKATLGYEASQLGGAENTVTLMLERNRTAFADLAQSANQTGVAHAVEGMSSNSEVYKHVQGLSVASAPEALARLSGDPHANFQSGLQAFSASAADLGPRFMHGNMVAGYRPGAAIAQSDGPLPASAWPTSKALPAWAEVVGHRQSVDGDGNAAKLTQNVYGLFIGADEEVGRNGWRVGGSLGFTTADAQVKAREASADTKSYSASVYTGKGFSHGMNRVNVLGGLAYTHHRISSERSVASLGQNLKAKYNANTLQLFGEVGYAMGQYSKQGMEPFAGINITQQRVGSFQESGGFAALRGQSSSDTSTSTTLGVRAHSDIKLVGKDTRLNGTLGWRHAWGDVSQSRTLSFEGSSSFTVAGAPLARNTALLGLQAQMELSRRAALELGYQGEYGGGTRDHAVNVKMRWAY